ncbi:MAG TPA: hypothetical protein EYN79_03875 [Planctomycetes bacterium]|nr:hypothetical protein [Planctomycetota bacterium]HIN79562.1 hypothetical protein [Planctomycetota bacterium]
MPGNQKQEFLPEDVCPCLRTKTMTLNTEYRRSAFEDRFTADTAFFHCLRTMAYHGPDQLDVRPDMCRPGRSCYPTPPDLI